MAKLDHMWVAFSWLKDIGLAQYSEIFEKNLVDGRMLSTFAKKDLEKHFSMTKKFHQVMRLSDLVSSRIRVLNYGRIFLLKSNHPLPYEIFKKYLQYQERMLLPSFHVIVFFTLIC